MLFVHSPTGDLAVTVASCCDDATVGDLIDALEHMERAYDTTANGDAATAAVAAADDEPDATAQHDAASGHTHQPAVGCEFDGKFVAAHTSLRALRLPRGVLVRVVPFAENDQRAITTIDDAAHSDLATNRDRTMRAHDAECGAATGDDRRMVLRVVGGLDASCSHVLGQGATRIGRSTANALCIDDPTVSRQHCDVRVDPDDGRVTVLDHHTTNGTWLGAQAVIDRQSLRLGDQIRVGASTIELSLRPESAPLPVLLSVTDDPTGRPGTWTVPFNRPPRPLTSAPIAPITVPDTTVPSSISGRIGGAALIVPVVLGIAMAVVMHNAMWAMFTLLSPVMAMAGWWDQRRHNRRARRGADRTAQGALRRFADALDQSVARETSLRHTFAPDLATLRRRAQGPSARLWERRRDDPDFLSLRVGIGTASWHVPLDGIVPAQGEDEPTPSVDSAIVGLINAASRLHDIPLTVDMRPGGVLGIVGPEAVTTPFTRGLIVQLCTLHGPADVTIDVLPHDDSSWEWTRWLPHRTTTATWHEPPTATQSPQNAPAPTVHQPVHFVVVTDPAVLDGHRSVARRTLLARGDVALVVVSTRREHLPATCTTVIECTDHVGNAAMHGRRVTEQIANLRLDGVGEATAQMVARQLAHCSDPDRDVRLAIPAGDVWLFDLLGLAAFHDADTLTIQLAQRWYIGAPRPAASWPLGRSADGTVSVDLDVDGPHVLVAGTTGAGKSELLRAMIVGLAANAPPSAMTFLLIDFKGGSAFAELADLPHTVGMVTDLSPALAHRTITVLEAELRTRERALAAAGCRDLRELSDGPARFVIVVDEFATLARDLPDVLDSLVSIAQRGRSLGVHLVLATQRPAGSVSDAIRANIGARIALRLQSASESNDVIDAPDAAHISRRTPGRASVRFGTDELLGVQVAGTSRVQQLGATRRVVCQPGFAGLDTSATAAHASPTSTDGQSDLTRFVVAARAAFAASGAPAPARLCPPPLTSHHGFHELADDPSGVLGVAVADIPAEQRRDTHGWILGDGPLVCIGVPGSGTSSALCSLGLRVAAHPVATHALMIFDGADRQLAPLGGLTHVAALIEATDTERQRRACNVLHAELRRRRASSSPADPAIVVLIDDATAFINNWADPNDGVIDVLGELITQGASQGIYCALACDRLGSVPFAWHASCTQRWTFRVADRADVPGAHGDIDDPNRPPGRFDDHARGITGHIAQPDDGVAAVVAQSTHRAASVVAHPQLRVGAMPHRVASSTMHCEFDGPLNTWQIPIGIGYDALAPVGWHLRPEEHAVITGTAQSGKSSTLVSIATMLRRSAAQPRVLCVSGRHVNDHPVWRAHLVAAPDLIAEVRACSTPTQSVFVLIDDADRLDDDGAGLAGLLGAPHPGVHIIATTDPSFLRSAYAHFLRHVRRSRSGLILCPDVDLDGEAFGVRLPRRAPTPLTQGRGYLVGAHGVQLLLAAHPDEPPDPPGARSS